LKILDDEDVRLEFLGQVEFLVAPYLLVLALQILDLAQLVVTMTTRLSGSTA
jgi:hypothetical protein